MAAIRHFDTLDSTMVKAAELAEAGAESGTVVVADAQTAGQGRMGRSWHSEPGAGLYVTFILRPEIPPERLPVVTLALGLAAVQAIVQTTSVSCDLRWPNDVLIEDRKCAGILAQLHGSVLLTGIGINVNQLVFPEEIASIATSLRLASGREHSRTELLNALIKTVNEHVDTLERHGKEPILRAFTQASSYVRGRRVVVDQSTNELRGTTDGLDSDGFLMVRQDNGARVQILAGWVRPECS
jgi:BirA family biotin operon repressor/biotin-[acetyl-CoA-carboxylase] ligase